MSSYPALTAAVADQHRRDLITQADAYRLARAARAGSGGGSSLPRRPALTVRRLVAAAAAGCTAVTLFTLSPAASSAHPSAHVFSHHFARTAASQFRWA
jgi:hypothetical protein